MKQSMVNKRIFLLIGVLLIFSSVIVFSAPPVTDSAGNYILETDNANFTINKSNGLIVGILDKNTDYQLLDTTQECGVSWFSDQYEAWDFGGSADVRNTNSNFEITQSDHIRVSQNQSLNNINITYDYIVENNNLKINLEWLFDNSTSGATENVSMRYNCDFAFNPSTDWNHTPSNSIDTQFTKTGTATVELERNAMGNNYLYLFNDTNNFMFTLTNPIPIDEDEVGTKTSQFRIRPSGTIDFEFQHETFMLNLSSKNFFWNFSMIINKDREEAKRQSYNLTWNKNETFMGHWQVYDLPNRGMLTNDKIQSYVDNNVKNLELQGWNPYAGLYPTAGTWTDRVGSLSFSPAIINDMINNATERGLNVFLYVSLIEVNKTFFTADDFPNDILINSTRTYVDSSDGKRYIMTLFNETGWKGNISTQIDNMLTTYENITGLFIDNLARHDSDYNFTHKTDRLYIDKGLGIPYINMADDYGDFLKNVTDRLRDNGKASMCNGPVSQSFVQHCDIISQDTDALKSISYDKLSSLGKPISFIHVGGLNPRDIINESILWGSYIGFQSTVFTDQNLTADEYFLLNYTAHARLIRHNADTTQTFYTEYSDVLASQTNFTFTDLDSNSFDYYFLNNHTLESSDTNIFQWNQSGNLTNVIWKGHFGQYYFSTNKNSSFSEARNTSGYVFDWRVPIVRIDNSTITTSNGWRNDFLETQNVTLENTGITSYQIYNKTNKAFFPETILADQSEVNISLSPNQEIYVIDVPTLTEGVVGMTDSAGNIIDTTINISRISNTEIHILSSATTFNATVTVDNDLDCDLVTAITYTSDSGVFFQNFIKGTDFTCASTITLNIRGIEEASNSNVIIFSDVVDSALDKIPEGLAAFAGFFVIMGIVIAAFFVLVLIKLFRGDISFVDELATNNITLFTAGVLGIIIAVVVGLIVLEKIIATV